MAAAATGAAAAVAAALSRRCAGLKTDSGGKTRKNYWVLSTYEGLGNLPTYITTYVYQQWPRYWGKGVQTRTCVESHYSRN